MSEPILAPVGESHVVEMLTTFHFWATVPTRLNLRFLSFFALLVKYSMQKKHVYSLYVLRELIE
jgi:hypothetical protein